MTDLEEAALAVCEAWNAPGPNPHSRLAAHISLKLKWSELFNAVDRLSKFHNELEDKASGN